MNADTRAGRTACDGGGQGWSNVPTRQGTPSVTGNLQKLGERRCPLGPAERAGPCANLDFGLLPTRPLRQ